MKDLKELMNEMELDKVVGGLARPSTGGSNLADLNTLASGLVSKLVKEGYTAEKLADSLVRLPLADILPLANLLIPDQLATGLVDEKDSQALADRLVDLFKRVM